MRTEIGRAVAGNMTSADEAEPLHRLATELVLTAAAAANGTMGYVVGRTHVGCVPVPALPFLSFHAALPTAASQRPCSTPNLQIAYKLQAITHLPGSHVGARMQLPCSVCGCPLCALWTYVEHLSNLVRWVCMAIQPPLPISVQGQPLPGSCITAAAVSAGNPLHVYSEKYGSR